VPLINASNPLIGSEVDHQAKAIYLAHPRPLPNQQAPHTSVTFPSRSLLLLRATHRTRVHSFLRGARRYPVRLSPLRHLCYGRLRQFRLDLRGERCELHYHPIPKPYRLAYLRIQRRYRQAMISGPAASNPHCEGFDARPKSILQRNSFHKAGAAFPEDATLTQSSWSQSLINPDHGGEQKLHRGRRKTAIETVRR
jgi:hypothetical protein